LVLPSLADVLLVVVLVVPGFVSYILFKKVAMKEKRTTDFEATIWSLATSLVVYAIFAYITGLYNIDLIRDNILVPNNILLIFGLALVFGGSFGILARVLFRRGYHSGDCWEECAKAAASIGSFVLIYTSDGKEYKGELMRAGISEAPREIVLKEPKMIFRDSKGFVVNEFNVGTTMLFNEKDILRVAFLKKIL